MSSTVFSHLLTILLHTLGKTLLIALLLITTYNLGNVDSDCL